MVHIDYSNRFKMVYQSKDSKIVKRTRRRKYDPVIIERIIGLVLGPCTALYRSFLKHCTPTNKAAGNIWQDLSKPPQRRQGPDPPPLLLCDCYTVLLLSLDLTSLPDERPSTVFSFQTKEDQRRFAFLKIFC